MRVRARLLSLREREQRESLRAKLDPDVLGALDDLRGSDVTRLPLPQSMPFKAPRRL